MTAQVFVNESKTWVVTDIEHYASRQDVINYLETLYPTKYDPRRRKYVQNYNVDTRPNGNHRVWAARHLRDDEVKPLEDKNNSKSKYSDEDDAD